MIYTRIADLFNLLGFSRSDVAYHIDVSKNTLNSWIELNTDPSLAHFLEICRYCDVSADFLLGFSDSPFLPDSDAFHYKMPDLISISDLTDDQREAICMTLKAFREANAASKKAI